MLIKNRPARLRERGKIKIGMKGQKKQSSGGKEFQQPVKLNHFLVTTMEVGPDGNFVPDKELMKAIGARVGQDADKLTRIPVILLFNDIELNFASRYAAYQGSTLWCSGDGETAKRRVQQPSSVGIEKFYLLDEVICPCPNLERDYAGKDKTPCKINGNLSVLIDGAPGVGGVWKFRTTSFNSTDGIFGSLAFISSVTGGQIAGLPLELVVVPKKVTAPGGKQQTIYVVGLEFSGGLPELRETALRIARENASANLQIEHVEQEARKMFEADDDETVFPDEDATDIADEFYPEEEEPPPVPEPEEALDGPEQNAAKPKRRGRKAQTVADPPSPEEAVAAPPIPADESPGKPETEDEPVEVF